MSDFVQANDAAYREALLAAFKATRWETALPFYCDDVAIGPEPYTLIIKLKPGVDQSWFKLNRIPAGYKVYFV